MTWPSSIVNGGCGVNYPTSDSGARSRWFRYAPSRRRALLAAGAPAAARPASSAGPGPSRSGHPANRSRAQNLRWPSPVNGEAAISCRAVQSVPVAERGLRSALACLERIVPPSPLPIVRRPGHAPGPQDSGQTIRRSGGGRLGPAHLFDLHRRKGFSSCASSKLLRPRNQGLTLRLNSGPKTAKLRRYARRCCLPRLTWRPCHSGDVSAPRADLVLENVALRQQVTALKKERPRPPLEDTERAFWLLFEVRGPCGQAACSSSTRTPWPVGIATDSDGTGQRSRSAAIPVGLGLMPRFAASSARWRKTGWGAPRIHAELTKLGFIISEITVSRYYCGILRSPTS